jgi:hypothetical protein
MGLKKIVTEEKQLIDLPVEKLAEHVLYCINAQSTNPIKRSGLAMGLLREYPREYVPQSLYAVEEALLWLEKELLIGLDPVDRELVFITRRGKNAISVVPSSASCSPVRL